VTQAFSALVETAVTDSLVFKLVDRRSIERYLQEIELALSDPTGSVDLSAGPFEETVYFIDGAVSEENGDFLISLRLVLKDTAAVITETGTHITQGILVGLGEDYGYQNVPANGIGLGLHFGSTRFPALFGSPPGGRGPERGSDGRTCRHRNFLPTKPHPQARDRH
jgi:hypothetical protein